MQFRISKFSLRRVWLQLHLYLALTIGLLFVCLGVTGSLSVYRESLDTLFNPRLQVSAAQRPPLSLDKLYAAVRSAQPQRYGAWTLELPASPEDALIAWFDKPHETLKALYAPLMLAVDPYSGEVLAARFWGDTLSTKLFDWHTQFGFGRAGWNLAGAAGALLLLSVLSGLYLWWPGWRQLRYAFAFRHDAGLMHLLHDTHRLLGVAGAGLLLLLAFTGVQLAFPELLETFAGSGGMAHGDVGPDVRSTAKPSNRSLNLAEAVAVARAPFPRAEVRRVTTPDGENGVYRVNLRQAEEINQRHPFTTVWVDRWSGQILEVRNPQRFSAAQSFAAWMWPLHTGEALGGFGRLLWFVAGFIPLLLYVAGMLLWLHRRGYIADRDVDLPAQRRAFAALMRERVWLPAQRYCQQMYPVVRQSLHRNVEQAMRSAVAAKLRQRFGALAEQFKSQR